MSILPFPSFLDDIKEKGLKRAVLEGVDEVVERMTAGMNLQDVREALRGEKPSRRPNPRLTPHADGFWLHMRPSYFHEEVTGLYPTFRLGWLSTYFVFFETITGIILMFWYTPAPEIAYENMLNILGNVPLGQLMRDLHRLGAEAMVLIVALHMMRTWFTGSYKKPRQFTWFTGVLLLVFTGLLSFTGYLLPWDQLSLWAVTIGASMVEATPAIGTEVNLLVRGAPELGANGLLRFYMVHVLALPVFLLVFLGVHYYKVIIHAHSLPPQSENIGEDTAKRVPLDKRTYFIPDILTSELLWLGITSFILIALCIWFYHAPLENHADSQVTPLGTTAPWYFLWVQGLLKLGDKLFMGVIFPTLLLGALAVMPYIDVGKSRRYADRRLGLTLAMLLITFMTITSYMGLPEFGVATSAELEIVHEIVKEPAHNHMGLIRPVPYDQLVPGWYTTRQFEEGFDINEFNDQIHTTFGAVLTDEGYLFMSQSGQLTHDLGRVHNLHGVPTDPTQVRFRLIPDNAPELYLVVEEFYHMLEDVPNELPNVWGAVIITENQAGLRRIDVVVSWDGVVIEDGEVVMNSETGEPEPMMQMMDMPVLDDEGNPVMVEELDAEGNPVMTDTGEPSMIEATEPVEVRVRNIFGEHIFIHEDAAYFQ